MKLREAPPFEPEKVSRFRIKAEDHILSGGKVLVVLRKHCIPKDWWLVSDVESLNILVDPCGTHSGRYSFGLLTKEEVEQIPT